MGLFDFFKKKQAPTPVAPEPEIDANVYLIAALYHKLDKMGYKVEKHPQYLSLIVNGDLEIAGMIIDEPNNHPSIIHAMFVTIHPVYFPEGIEEHLAGLGSTIEEKVETALVNYIQSIFLTIMDSLSDSHVPELDFMTMTGDQMVLWHPKIGDLMTQEQWMPIEGEPLYEVIGEKVKKNLTGNKLNWIKLFAAKQPDGSVIAECILNNVPWPEGTAAIGAYAESWDTGGRFKTMKQFIMFRKCDEHDTPS